MVTVSVSMMAVVRAKKVGQVKTVKRKCVVMMCTTLLIIVLSVRAEAATITFQVKSTTPSKSSRWVQFCKAGECFKIR